MYTNVYGIQGYAVPENGFAKGLKTTFVVKQLQLLRL